MPNQEIRNRQITKIHESAEAVLSVSLEDLERTDLSHNLTFQAASDNFRKLRRILTTFKASDLTCLTSTHLEGILKLAERIRALQLSVNQFTIEEGNPSENRKHLLNEIDNCFDVLVPDLMPALAYLTVRSLELETRNQSAKDYSMAMHHAKKEAEEMLYQEVLKFQNKVVELNHQIAEEIAAFKLNVAQYAIDKSSYAFTHARKSYDSQSLGWLIATLFSGLITLGVAIYFLRMSYHFQPPSVEIAIQIGFSKILLVTILMFSIVWSAKNYRSCRHNSVLSKHRSDALGTFRVFARAAVEPDTRNAILLAATQAIFSGRTTGFDNNDDTPQSQPIVELLTKTMTSSSKPDA